MKPLAWRTTPLFAALLALAACSGPTTMSRVQANRALYDTWPSEIKEAVLAQKAIPGMNRDMVRVALGQPKEVLPGQNVGEEVWVYDRAGESSGGSGPVLQVGTNVGSMQVGGSTGGGGVMGPGEDAGEVLFKDGIVVRSNVVR